MLENSKEVFTIIFVSDDINNYDPKTKEIRWNMLRAPILSDGKSVLSPAITLAHELGHGAQHLEGVLDGYFDGTKTRDQIEADNMMTHEIPIANQLGEFTRKYYYDFSGFNTVSTSTLHMAGFILR